MSNPQEWPVEPDQFPGDDDPDDDDFESDDEPEPEWWPGAD